MERAGRGLPETGQGAGPKSGMPPPQSAAGPGGRWPALLAITSTMADRTEHQAAPDPVALQTRVGGVDLQLKGGELGGLVLFEFESV